MNYEEFEEYCLDKTKWPDGPWKDEPDELEWVDEETGYTCKILRNNELGGFLIGYVELPKTHPEYGKNSLTESDIDVHGGISFHGTRDDGDWYAGFDCGHFFDACPFEVTKVIAPELNKSFSLSSDHFLRLGGTYKDINFVKAECTKLAKALKDMENSPE